MKSRDVWIYKEEASDKSSRLYEVVGENVQKQNKTKHWFWHAGNYNCIVKLTPTSESLPGPRILEWFPWVWVSEGSRPQDIQLQ